MHITDFREFDIDIILQSPEQVVKMKIILKKIRTSYGV